MMWWVLQAVALAGTALALVYGLKLLRTYGEQAREAAQLLAQAAQLQAQAAQAAQTAIAAAGRVQRLAMRPVLKVSLVLPGLASDVGHTPVVFALRLHNVGHGTAVIDEIRLNVGGDVALTYTEGSAAQLTQRIGDEVFQKAVGSSAQALSARLTAAPLADDARALEAAGALDLLRVQVFAHNATTVEQGLEKLSAGIRYRDLDGVRYDTSEQFRAL